MSDDLRRQAESLSAQLSQWRRALHRHPELGFEETWTAAFVEERLRALGIETKTGVGRTGVVGLLRGTSGGAEGATLLRADMDALPVQEVDGREYGSEVPGKMHACGHDGHMAMLLGAATLLAGSRDRLSRDVVLCFQPAEEGRGGAREMIRDGVLSLADVREAYALHLWSQFPSGTVQVRPGPTMAAQDEFTATVRGRGGHGALPHRAIDPTLAAAHAIVGLQSVVSRSVDPIESAVLTVGSLHAGSAPNVIPDHAVLEGTLRSFTEPVREILRRRTGEVLRGIASAHGCEVDFDLRPGYPAVVNDGAAVERVRRTAARVLGADRLVEPDPMAAAEDFAYFLEQVPGAFVFIGAGDEARGIVAPHHSPEFDIDEGALPAGAALLAALALDP